MNKYTIYTDNTQESTDFVSLCRTHLESGKSQIVVLSEGTDFNLSDIEAGKSAGVSQNILFRPKGPVGAYHEHFCVSNLLQVIKYI